jgi:hypothetical protein
LLATGTPATLLSALTSSGRQNIEGYGMIQLNEVLRLSSDSSVLPYSTYVFDICKNSIASMNTDKVTEYQFRSVAGSNRPLKATLVW